MNKVKLLVLVFAVSLVSVVAVAQVPSGMYGYDTGTFPDGGIVRKVQVDSQGRLVVTGAGSTDAGVFPADGGFPTTGYFPSAPYPCGAASRNGAYRMDGGAVTLGSVSPRVYIVACNSKENTSGDIKCRGDGTAPSLSAGSPGVLLSVGDCVPYANTSGVAVKCIGGSNYVSTYECAP